MPRSRNTSNFTFHLKKLIFYTLFAAAVLESPVSSSGLSALPEPDLADKFSEELKDDSRSITELLFTGERDIGLDTLFCFPSED